MHHLVLYTVCIAIFMSLHGPAGACILVASALPIHAFPIRVIIFNTCNYFQYVTLSIVVHTNIVYLYICTHVIQSNLMTPQLVGKEPAS